MGIKLNRVTAILLIISIVLVLGGCSQKATTESVSDTQNQKIDDLSKKVSDLELKANKIQELENEVTLLKALQSGNKIISIDPTASGYRKIDTDSGVLYVSIQKTEPYLDGVKVYLNVGNPMYANYQGLSIKAIYGKENTIFIDKQKREDWEKSLKEKEIDVSAEINAGRWTPVSFVLPSIVSTDFRYLSLEITTDTINMIQ